MIGIAKYFGGLNKIYVLFNEFLYNKNFLP